MTSETTTFEIIPSNLDKLSARLSKLSRKAVKLGMSPIVLTVVGEKFVEVSEVESGEIVKRMSKRLLITVVGESPKVNGWSFVGVIEHHEEGNILRYCPPYSAERLDITRFRTSNRTCEHCKQDRKRKDTYIIVNEDGRVAQVGRNCLKDFTGHASPEALAEWASILAALPAVVEGYDECDGQRGEIYYDLLEILSLTACVVRRDGFTSRKSAEEKSVASLTPVSSTADFIKWFVSPSRDEESRKVKAEYVVTDSDEMKAELAQSWASEADVTTDNDYLWNLQVVANMGEISSRQMGLAVSMISAYQREADRIANRFAERQNRPVSQFVGTIKKRENFVVTLNKIIVNEGFYGRTYIHLFVDANGNKMTWFSSVSTDMEEGNTYEIKATVTGHEVYKEENITKINRALVVKNLSSESEMELQMAVA